MSRRKGEVRIGTSGWHYGHWIGPFYPKGTRKTDLLKVYAESFDTAEINNTFYSLPSEATVKSWAADTPAGFRFAVKASRYLTHMRKLKEPKASSEKLFQAIAPLGRKLGPVLLQLPPNWKPNPERLDEALAAMPKGRYAVELRDERWLIDEVFQVLERHRAALCLYDYAGRRSTERVTGDFVYLRLHGPNEEAYTGSYSGQALAARAREVAGWRDDGLDVFVYFDNDEAGHAALNARDLKDKLG
jgi:uncharacterized protein YecE (DUF72 family)